MPARSLAFIHCPAIEAFRYPPDCPFKPERAGRTRERRHALGLLAGDARRELAPQPATRAELERFHDPGYLDELERAAAGDLTVAGLHCGLGQPDTPVFADLARYAAWAAGATLTGAECVRQEPAAIAFNPSGGGGYQADNTVRAWTLAWQTLGGDAEGHDWSFGLGGVMLGSTEWAGGLQDRARPPSDEQRRAVVPAVDRAVTAVTRRVFPIHGLQP